MMIMMILDEYPAAKDRYCWNTAEQNRIVRLACECLYDLMATTSTKATALPQNAQTSSMMIEW